MLDSSGVAFTTRWRTGGLLGRGHSARICVAHNDELGTTAACKLATRAPGMKWDRLVGCFERESALLKRCSHPNIVDVLGLYVSDSDVALVVSLAPCGDCQQLLQRHGALAERAGTAIAQQVCAALDHLHTYARCLHRDVKLENVLVVDTGGSTATPTVQLCDLGHSCTLDEPHICGCSPDDGFKGTRGYAAPEVVNGAPWTIAADNWGLGVVYYALLANELLRWKNNAPDVSTKTSRAFSQVSAPCKMRIKALLLTEPAERLTLEMLNRMLLTALAPPALLSPSSVKLSRSPSETDADVVNLDGDVSFGCGGLGERDSLAEMAESSTVGGGLRRSQGGSMRRAYSHQANLSSLGVTSSPTMLGVGRLGFPSNSESSASPSISKNPSCASSMADLVGQGGSYSNSLSGLATADAPGDLSVFIGDGGGGGGTLGSLGRGSFGLGKMPEAHVLAAAFDSSVTLDVGPSKEADTITDHQKRTRLRSKEGCEEEPEPQKAATIAALPSAGAPPRASLAASLPGASLPQVPPVPTQAVLTGVSTGELGVPFGASRSPTLERKPVGDLTSKSQRTAKLLAALNRAQYS